MIGWFKRISKHLNRILLAVAVLMPTAPDLAYKVYINSQPINAYNSPILPTTTFAETPNHALTVRACKGQYQSAAFSIRTQKALSNFTVTPGTLSKGGDTIPGSAVEVRAVKCWYQASALTSNCNACNSIDAGVRSLVPELLLKDDDLVRVERFGYNLTSQTIAINTVAQTLTRATGNWLTDGAKAGDIGTLTGCTTEDNDGEYTISAATPLVLTYSTSSVGASPTTEAGSGSQAFTNRHNYLRKSGGQNLISGRRQPDTGESWPEGKLLLADWPVDNAALQPLNIPSGYTKQFWLTVHVPADAVAGTYQGVITLLADGIPNQTIALTLQVHAFALEQANLYYGMIYYAATHSVYGPSISHAWKNPTQYAAEIADMVRHGIKYPTFGCYPDDASVGFESDLDIRAAAGLPRDFIMLSGPDPEVYGMFYNVAPGTEGQIANYIAKLQTLKDRVDAYDDAAGWGTLLVSLKDEALHDALVNEVTTLQAVQAIGVNTYSHGNNGTAAFDATGAALDLFISAWEMHPEDAADWHSIGKKMMSYGNPMATNENPHFYRRNYGWLLFKNNYDGCTVVSYMGQYTDFIWNDFAGNYYRNHNLTYPTSNGAIDTVAFEGLMEAVNDMRYLATLQKAITDHPGATADAAAAWIATVSEDDDLDATRQTMVNYINTLIAE